MLHNDRSARATRNASHRSPRTRSSARRESSATHRRALSPASADAARIVRSVRGQLNRAKKAGDQASAERWSARLTQCQRLLTLAKMLDEVVATSRRQKAEVAALKAQFAARKAR